MTLIDNPRPRIAVVGAGALGGFYGARLAKTGHDVHFLARSDYDVMKNEGLSVRSFEGDFALPPGRFGVYRDPRDVPTPDLVLVALKATGNSAYEPLVGPMLGKDTTLLTLQNGLGNEDQLARLFGAERVTGGMAFVCINRTGPGKIHHIDHGFLKVGEYQAPGGPPPGSTPRVERVAALFRDAGIKVDVLPDLRRGRWEKLTWNVPFNGLGAVLDLTTDRLLNSEAGMNLLTRVMEEVIASAAAEGITLPPGLIERQISNTRTMGAYRSSMQVDRQEGRPLEVEAILGEPLRRAQQLGVPTPTLRSLYEMARLIDPGAANKV